MNLTEDMLKYAMKYVLEHAPEEMEFFNSFVDKTVLERMNNVITLTSVASLIQKQLKCFKNQVLISNTQ